MANAKRKPKETAAPAVQRGSLVLLKKKLESGSNMVVIVSNDFQNEASDYLLAIPLERRAARLKAPFSVDLGRADGMRDLHTARCDWVTRIKKNQIKNIERASFSEAVLRRLEEGLKVALGFRELI